MNTDEAQARMAEIQRIMERATLFTLLPGWPAVVGGLMVLAGCGASYGMFRSLDFADILKLSPNAQAAFCVMWFAIGVAGVLLEVIFTRRAAIREQLLPADRPLRVAAFSLMPSIAVAVVLTAKFLLPIDSRVYSAIWAWDFSKVPLVPEAKEIQYIVPIWMMLYGTGVYTAGLFSIRAPRVVGLTFLVLGMFAMLVVPQYGVVSAAMSFGLIHIVFGLYVVRKQRGTVVR
jgi:hypothetical protein